MDVYNRGKKVGTADHDDAISYNYLHTYPEIE